MQVDQQLHVKSFPYFEKEELMFKVPAFRHTLAAGGGGDRKKNKKKLGGTKGLTGPPSLAGHVAPTRHGNGTHVEKKGEKRGG